MDKLDLLRKSPLFEMLSQAELEMVAELARPRRFVRDQVVFQEGDRGESLYVIASGEVEVLRKDGSGKPKRIAILKSPEFFGEMALVDREERSATVRSLGETAALELTAENFNTFRKHSRDGFTFVVVNIARVLSGRLRETNQKLAERL